MEKESKKPDKNLKKPDKIKKKELISQEIKDEKVEFLDGEIDTYQINNPDFFRTDVEIKEAQNNKKPSTQVDNNRKIVKHLIYSKVTWQDIEDEMKLRRMPLEDTDWCNDILKVLKDKKKYTGEVRLYNKKPSPAGTIIERMRVFGAELRENVLSEQLEIKEGEEWTLFTEGKEKILLKNLSEKTAYIHETSTTAQVKFNKIAKIDFQVFGHAVGHENPVNPFLEWVTKKHSDFKKHFEGKTTDELIADMNKIFADCFTFTHKGLAEWGLPAKLVEIVSKQHRPGRKFDWTVVPAGKQSIGKSTLFISLFPENSTWFSGDLSFADDKKQILENCQGTVLAEFSECTGLNKANKSFLKNFLTCTVDKVRFAYGRYAESKPRRFSLVGTTNERKPLPFSTGPERRFIILEVKTAKGQTLETNAKNVSETIKKYRDKLWALAVELHKRKWPPLLPDGLKETALQISEEYSKTDELLENAMDKFLEKRAGNDWFRLEEPIYFVKKFNEDFKKYPPQKLADSVADILRKKGWNNPLKRVKGHPIRVWTKVTPV